MDARGEDVEALGLGETLQCGEGGQAVESEKDAGDGAARAVVAHLLEKTGREVDGFEQIEESALGVGAGDDCFGGDFFAGGESDAGDRAVPDEDAHDFGVGTDFGAGLLHGGGEGV